MKIQNKKVESLVPYLLNNRKHSEKQTDRIASSIKEFGFNQPIVIDSNNVVIVGHGRLEAAKKLGLKEVPAVEVGELTDAQIKAYRILDNKLQNDSEWDIDNLQLEFGVLNDLDFDLSFGGLEELSSLFDKEEPEVAEDDFEPEEIDEPFIKQGDLIELGRHRVLCGDSTSKSEVTYLMNGKKAGMLFTDPPYGVNYEGGHNEKKREKLKNDELSHDFLSDLFYQSLNLAINFTDDDAAFYVWFASGKSVETFAAFAKLPLTLRAVIQWYKIKSGLGAFMSQYIPNCEPCIYAHKTKKSPKWFGQTDEKTVWELPKEKTNEFHPTQKPVALPARAIKNSSRSGDVVLDLFLGSGSTLIAAEQLGRTCYGMELSPKYCQVIIERYKKYCEDNNKAFECKINGEEYKA